jgi:acetoacetyl-CoA reductase/3-oxoacyl-[acyl-carrier protein] reductase
MATIAVHPETRISLERRLEGKVALVTGASRGIGRAIAMELADRGAAVAVNFRTSLSAAQELREDIHHRGCECELFQEDISDGQHARKLMADVLECFHRIDILVNNAGITRDRSIRKMTDEDWAEVIDTNLNSVFFCTSAAVPSMIEQKYGRIVNIASFVGQAGNFGQVNYAASKGGIIAMTKALALELARYNITVNAVAPGFTETEMVTAIPAEILQQIIAKVPMKRLARPEEVAKTVAFLLCDGDYITGQQINVNGGIYM